MGKTNFFKILTVAAVGFMVIGVVETALAELIRNACQQTDPAADFVDITGGSTTCEPMTDMCCEINNGVGFCDAASPPIPGFPTGQKFRVYSEIVQSGEFAGAIHWWVDPDPDLTNTFPDGKKTVGASGGSNCFYGYEPDQDETTGAGYVKNNFQYSGVQRVIFFSDGVNEIAEQPLPPVPNCEIEGASGMVADVMVTCPEPNPMYDGSFERWVIVAEVRNEMGIKNKSTLLGFIDPTTGDIDPTNFCKCNKGDNAAGQDENCNPNIQPGTPPVTEGEYAGLPACDLSEALGTPVVIELQNPTCVGAGSSRRCY